MMRVHLGADHAGFDLKNHLARELARAGHEVIDHGPVAFDPEDDYPVCCLRAAAAVVADQQAGRPALGVVVGGSGNGEQIAANKVRGVRAALAWSRQTAELARRHNDANVVAIGARLHSATEATDLVQAFLATGFSGEARHRRRIGMLAAYETTGELPPADG